MKIVFDENAKEYSHEPTAPASGTSSPEPSAASAAPPAGTAPGTSPSVPDAVGEDEFEDEYDRDYRKQTSIFNKVIRTVAAAFREPVFVVCLVILLLLTMFVRAFLVPSASMRPTLVEGDRILSIAQYFPNGHTYKPGDIICFVAPSNEIYVKRVVACGGDLVEMTGDKLYVNGEESPYSGTSGVITTSKVQLADDEYWVMGDNRGNSQDSRFIGPVKADKTVAKVWCVFWPLDHLTWLG